ncbi:hypothetical protein M405DRAFT_884566 [Rhizopogon salebrosus TDB-379]|nr:hypothetical protein M405DRAFT_884566 [Rhizopogon salebrosus TDB-379]
MDDPTCIGCGEKYKTKKTAFAHAAGCSKNKSLTLGDVLSKLERNRKSRARDKLHDAKRARLSDLVDEPLEVLDIHQENPLHWCLYDETIAGPSNQAPPLPLPPQILSKRSGRAIRMPRHFVDYLPGSAIPLAHTKKHLLSHVPPQPDEHPPPNIGCLTDVPTLERQQVTGSNAARVSTGISLPDVDIDHFFDVFTNTSCGLLMAWLYSGTPQESNAEAIRLARYTSHPSFRGEETFGFNPAREVKLLDKFLLDKSNPFRGEHGWHRSTVKIHLQIERKSWTSEAHAPELEVLGVYDRSLTSIIRSTFEDDISKTFHMTPYSQYWKVSDTKTVFSEAYSSPATLDAYTEINNLPREPYDNLERVVAPLMMWSDATHLTNFGDASLWLFCLYFGNQSKYTRGKPTSKACHHVAYIPKLPDNLQDIYMDIFGEGTTLDSRSPHILVLLATIKFPGQCLCPRCLIKKSDVPKMGTKLDMKRRTTQLRVDDARRHRHVNETRTLIFESGAAVHNDESYVPVHVKRILYSAVAIQFHFLHEFELGVWKAILFTSYASSMLQVVMLFKT